MSHTPTKIVFFIKNHWIHNALFTLEGRKDLEM